jgi:hypothetical protein
MRTNEIAIALAALMGAAAPGFADEPKFEYRAPATEPAPKPTVWKANMTAGVIWADGNAQSIGVSGSGFVGVKHYNNSAEFFAQGNYSKVGQPDVKGGPVTHEATATEFWLWRLRYDRYFLKKNTFFVTYQMAGDRPSGYVYRLEPQAGYSRLFFESPHQLFKGEIGYDYTFEHRPPGITPRNADFHSVRLFLGYENKFTPYATFTEGLEVLWSPDQAERNEHVRVNSLTSVSSMISKNVSLKLNFTVKANFDPPLRPSPPNPPNQTFQDVDTILEAVLAVTFL